MQQEILNLINDIYEELKTLTHVDDISRLTQRYEHITTDKALNNFIKDIESDIKSLLQE